jgi:hypothetical protein
MKTLPLRNPPAEASASSQPRPNRRQLVVGAGVAAGAAVAATVLRQPAQTPVAVADTGTDKTTAEGYRLTEHVRRYYETTRT